MKLALLATAAALVATPASAQTTVSEVPNNAVTNRVHDGPQEQALAPSIQALQTTLTELQNLQLQLKQAHWNVSGTLWYTLHGLLQEHYEGTAKYADMIAERLQSIGVSSDGRATTIVRTSKLPEITGGFLDDAQVIALFAGNYRTVSDEIGQGIEATSDSDPTTSNLLQEVQAAIDKYQWQVRAFVQATPNDPNTGTDINNGRPVAIQGDPRR